MIRRAERKDIPALMEIYNEAILHTTATFDTETKDEKDRTEWFLEHTGRYVIFVYEEAGAVMGYASLSRYRDRKAFDPAVEISIYIHEKYRGRGIGGRLMEETLKYAKGCREIGTVISLITSDNEVSIHLHEKFGFSYCGQIRNAGVKFGKNLSLNAYQIIYDRE
ncbi:MAG: N-acetyltransferase [Roseburia sp.]|nr:N-acetyltransferase [Roseburia sp.]